MLIKNLLLYTSVRYNVNVKVFIHLITLKLLIIKCVTMHPVCLFMIFFFAVVLGYIAICFLSSSFRKYYIHYTL